MVKVPNWPLSVPPGLACVPKAGGGEPGVQKSVMDEGGGRGRHDLGDVVAGLVDRVARAAEFVRCRRAAAEEILVRIEVGHREEGARRRRVAATDALHELGGYAEARG